MPVEKMWPSATYKFTPPDHISKHSGYFTIVGDDEPIAFFFNSKEMASFQWITSLMIANSKLVKAGVPIENIIHDMKGVYDPNGSYFCKEGEVHSTVHHIGLIIERHMLYIIDKWNEADTTIDGEVYKREAESSDNEE